MSILGDPITFSTLLSDPEQTKRKRSIYRSLFSTVPQDSQLVNKLLRRLFHGLHRDGRGAMVELPQTLFARVAQNE